MIEPDRIISPDISVAEERFDRALRPVSLADYAGQPVVVEQLDIFIQAARKRDEPLDHTLVFGPCAHTPVTSGTCYRVRCATIHGKV